LKAVLNRGGYQLIISMDSKALARYFEGNESAPKILEIDAWLVDLDDGDIQVSLDLLIEHSELPLLVNDEVPPIHDITEHELWQRRLLEKLEVVAISQCGIDDDNKITEAVMYSSAANKVWVLVASLGGPEAIKRFFSQLPPQLPIAMVYGQHIEKNFDSGLVAAMSANHSYPMSLVRGEKILRPGEVAVVPVDYQLRFLPHGRVVATRSSWSGSYQPTFDQVIADLARVYRENLGVIVFSGMCNDGEIGCRVAKACGAHVWAQTPDSCLSPDMPNAAIATGCVSYQGSPEQLAMRLAKSMAGKRHAEEPLQSLTR
jgi:chemosensory pili system protein ChpB (putative protein-glutamate methylesterase)